MNVDYFCIEGAPGKFFRCPGGQGTLSVPGCATLHKRAAKRPEGCLAACVGCPVGAFHAGEIPALGSSRFYGRKICARCYTVSPRIIRGTLCPSCYNREQEVLRGKNRKGTRPVSLRPVGPVSLLLCQAGGASVRRFERVADRTEAMLSVLMSAPGTVIFCEV